MPTSDQQLPTFDYKLVRSRRKTLSIQVSEAEVVVRAPLKVSNLLIQEFIREKTLWAIKHLEEQRLRQQEVLIIAHDQQAPFFGKQRLIQISQGSNKVEIDDNFLHIRARDTSPDKVNKLYQKWLQEQAREYMATQTIKLARDLKLGHKLKEVVFRKTKTKWGHCCQDGTIQYNWLAMMAPKPVVDYLVAHETSHLKHMNHSARFWNTVGELCPDYKELRGWLKDNGHKIWLK